MLWVYPNSSGSESNRGKVDTITQFVHKANTNLNFVQSRPCGIAPSMATNAPLLAPSASNFKNAVKIWPNPSENSFNLRPAITTPNERVQLRVYDNNGRMVYQTIGPANKDYRFGNDFNAGLYLVEIIQGKQRSTLKLIKQ